MRRIIGVRTKLIWKTSIVTQFQKKKINTKLLFKDRNGCVKKSGYKRKGKNELYGKKDRKML